MSLGPDRGRTPPPKELRETSDVEPGYLPTRWELRDFLISWVLISLAFAILFLGGGRAALFVVQFQPLDAATLLVLSLLTAGIGFVAHELAHRVVAIRLGHDAAFRAHYGMLMLAIVCSLAGFIFAAPGGVYHRIDVSPRDRGLIALAGPVTNLALAVGGGLVVAALLYANVFTLSVLDTLGETVVSMVFGVLVVTVPINLFLAGFNMLPFGPLDGEKVYVWNTRVYLLVAVPSILLGAGTYLLVFLY